MVKKCIHISDIHIRTYRLHDEYMDVFNYLLTDIKNKVSSYNKDEIRIVIAGDIVHQKIIISNEQLMLTTSLLIELEKIAPLIIIAGNHDLLENNSDRLDSITPMIKFLQDKNINYFKESKCYLDDNIVWCIYSIFEHNAKPDIKTARKTFGDDKTYIGLFHGPINGFSTDVGYEFSDVYELKQFEDCDMVMCGDIHKRSMSILKSGEKEIPVAFSSSLIQQNFGETVSKHGYLLWDVETKTFDECDITNRFPLYNFRINSLDDLDNNGEIITNL